MATRRTLDEPLEADAYDGPELEPAPDSDPEAAPVGSAWAHSVPALRVTHELPREVSVELDRIDAADPLDHPTFAGANDEWLGPGRSNPRARKHARARTAYLDGYFARLRLLRRLTGNTTR